MKISGLRDFANILKYSVSPCNFRSIALLLFTRQIFGIVHHTQDHEFMSICKRHWGDMISRFQFLVRSRNTVLYKYNQPQSRIELWFLRHERNSIIKFNLHLNNNSMTETTSYTKNCDEVNSVHMSSS